MSFDIYQVDLRVLNSATKYPSIPTYHMMDTRDGTLWESAAMVFPPGEPVLLTEKVDGTNARVIVTPNNYFEGNPSLIGSREELLWAEGDLIANPQLGIVETLRPLIEDHASSIYWPNGYDDLTVFYFEVYGHGIGKAAKEYTLTGKKGYRLFDVARVPLEVLEWPVEKVASWRDHGGQQWLNEDELRAIADKFSLVELCPRIETTAHEILPHGIQETLNWLRTKWPDSRVTLDVDAPGHPEGIVLRTRDRRMIAKARFEDYERTLKRQRK